MKNHTGTAIRKHGARNTHELIWKLGWLHPEPAVPEPRLHPQGEPHQYKIECAVVPGQPGMIRLSVDPNFPDEALVEKINAQFR